MHAVKARGFFHLDLHVVVRLACFRISIFIQGQYEIISLSGSFIRAEQGGKTGGLSVSLSRSDGQIIGGAVGTHLTAAGPVQVKSSCVIVPTCICVILVSYGSDR